MKTLLLVVASLALTQCFSSVPSCSSDEAELAGKRIQTFIGLNKALTNQTSTSTFNLELFLSQLAPLFTPDISYHVPLGVGHLVGLQDVGEYLALGFSSVNANLYYLDSTSESPNDDLSIDGDVYTISASIPLTYFPTVTPSVKAPFEHETEIIFSPCSEKIATYTVKRTPSFDNFVRMGTWTAIHSTYQGMFDVCAFHEAYCTGEHRQYENFSSCLAYLTALPDLPAGCPWAPFAGHAKPCKARHSNLAPFDSNHCYHMGPLTLADGTPNYDLNGKLSHCSDAHDCPARSEPDFVLGEPTAEFLASMNAYDAAIATEYNNPITNFSLGHYKFPELA